MPQHDHVGVERLDVLRGVAEGFALGRAGGGGVEGDDIGTQELGGHLEGDAGTGAGLEEEVDDGLAPEGGDFLDLAVKDAAERAGGVEDLVDLGTVEFLDGQEMFAMPGHVRIRVK